MVDWPVVKEEMTNSGLLCADSAQLMKEIKVMFYLLCLWKMSILFVFVHMCAWFPCDVGPANPWDHWLIINNNILIYNAPDSVDSEVWTQVDLEID